MNARVQRSWSDASTDTRQKKSGRRHEAKQTPSKKNDEDAPSLALSTCEAEYMAASEVGKEIKYLRALLRDAGSTQDQPANVYEDNLGGLATSANPVRRKSSAC